MIRNILVFLSVLSVFAEDPTPVSGPYKQTFESIKNCSKLRQPYVKNPGMVLRIYLKNTPKGSLITGNLSVVRDVGNVKVNIKSYIWRNGKWEINYVINSLDCHGMLIHLITVAMNVPYERKTCTYRKGSHVFRDINPNQVTQLWMKNMEYGRILWRVAGTVAAGTLFCLEAVAVVEPA